MNKGIALLATVAATAGLVLIAQPAAADNKPGKAKPASLTSEKTPLELSRECDRAEQRYSELRNTYPLTKKQEKKAKRLKKRAKRICSVSSTLPAAPEALLGAPKELFDSTRGLELLNSSVGDTDTFTETIGQICEGYAADAPCEDVDITKTTVTTITTAPFMSGTALIWRSSKSETFSSGDSQTLPCWGYAYNDVDGQLQQGGFCGGYATEPKPEANPVITELFGLPDGGLRVTFSNGAGFVDEQYLGT